jgi:ADP-ribosylglycohydrolase
MRRASGCLFGLAFGDALGAVTEFLNVDEILRRFPPNGLQELSGNPALVTDDTQMTLASSGNYTATTLEPLFRK